MPTIDAHDPGTICWIDLASTDAAGATAFYCDLFGWTATEPVENAGGYRMLLHDGRQVAGLAPVWGDTDVSVWSTYVVERRRRPDVRGGPRERRRGRHGRHGRARRRAHGGAARSRGRAGVGLAAGRAPRLPGARRAGRADLERADDARHRDHAGVLRLGLRLDVAGAGPRRRPLHRLEARRTARGRRARDGRDLARQTRCRTGWSTSRPPTATRPRAAAASSAAPSGTRRTTSAPVAARCSRTRRAARSRSSSCADAP